MSVRIRQLRLRVETSGGAFGADIPFGDGLNVLWAENTTGKSTALQSILYAFGLERMLSPRREIPLTYVMTSHLEDPDTNERHEVLESSVSLELQNTTGEIITVKRGVVTGGSRKLVSVFDGPALSDPSDAYRQRDYFVLDPGAAQREAGFHRMLVAFFGWHLPTVRRYDGSEVPLYLETIFPLFYVEQKAGWSSLPAAFPTYFQIRDVARRALEFALALETHDVELSRQRIELEVAQLKSAWSAKRVDVLSTAHLINGRVEGFPTTPTVSEADVRAAVLLVSETDTWHPLEVQLSALRARLAGLMEQEVPLAETVASGAAGEVVRLAEQVAEQNARRSTLFRVRQTEVAQRQSAAQRLTALEEDLQKNRDAQKLRDLGSTVVDTFAAEHCPTCGQPIADTLLAQQASAAIMAVEDNIEYIKAQTGIFSRMREQSDARIKELDRELAVATEEMIEVSARLRALKADLVAPGNSPSVATIEERVRLASRIQALEQAELRFEQQKRVFEELSIQYRDLLTAQAALPSDRLTPDDNRKLDRFGALIREQLIAYRFSTFSPNDLEISPETYKPQKEGFEIGFELSASDAIRLKWAYQLGLLELSRVESTHHPGFLIFDEPRQQETAKVSFKNLLARAGTSKAAGQQVIFATSEDHEQLEGFLRGVDCSLMPFEGRIIRRL